MSTAAPRRSSARAAVALAAGAAVVALISASQLYLNWLSQGFEASFARLAAGKLVEWGLWALFVPVIVRVDRSVGFSARSPGAAFLAHVGAAVALFAISNAALAAFTAWADPAAAGASFVDIYLGRAGAKLLAALVVYAAILGGYWLLRLRDERHREAARSARLLADLSDARLRSLTLQLQPHFLFNALHTIADLVREGDRERAVETLEELGGLLRRALRDPNRQEVPLREELDFLEGYLRIQRLRFGDRLDVRVRAEPPALDAIVPAFLLQPLVENAIRHGLDLENGAGRVLVDARVAGGELRLRVEDNGVGPSAAAPPEGVGLGTTRSRLEALYGSRAGIALEGLKGGGASVDVTLPHRAAPPGAAETAGAR